VFSLRLARILCLISACAWSSAHALDLENIGKPTEGQYTSRLTTINGELFEYVSQFFYRGGAWRPMRDDERAAVDGGLIVNVAMVNRKTYKFTIRGKTCPGLSVFSDDGYHGSFTGADTEQFSGTYTDGKLIIANVQYRIFVGDMPPARRVGECFELPLDRVGPEGDWIYAYHPLPGGVLFGGRAGDDRECAPLRVLDAATRAIETIELPDCRNGLVTEFYAFAEWQGEVLIGNFPLGTLYAFNPTMRSVRLTDYGRLQPDDLVRADGLPYRESQSLLVHDGKLYIGMYAWAELFVYDQAGNLTLTRMLEEPRAKGAELMPYAAAITHGIGGRSGEDDYRDREWSQRISSIAVVGGRVCTSTGNRSGLRYDPIQHPIPERAAAKYGEIFCINHTGP
jgi:hypothetical protein